MRQFFLKVLGTAAGFYVVQYFLAGVHLDPTPVSYLITSVVFVIFNFFLSPLIKLLLLPINLLTLGIFRWISNIIVLYLFDLLYDGINISAFAYPGLTSPYLSLPPTHLNLFWVLVLSSLLLNLTVSILSRLFNAES